MSNPKIYADGLKEWLDKNGYTHRDDGPAVITYKGSKCWYIHGERHREDGPAVEWYDGGEEWWYNGKQINCNTQEEFEQLIRLELFW